MNKAENIVELCQILLYFAQKSGSDPVDLVIDIGNSSAKMAVFDGDELVETFHSSNQSLDCLPQIALRYPLRQGILSSVIDLSEQVSVQVETMNLKMLHLDSHTPVPVVNLYKSPQTLGADRLAAVVGACGLQPGRDCLVIDAGTCITYDFVDAAGQYHGGNISPGLDMRLKALHSFTGRLPLVSQNGELPHWGDTTETAIRAGVIRGISMEVEGYIRRERERNPGLLVFLTGGDAFPLDAETRKTTITDRCLVLRGLNRILKYNDTLS